MKLIHSDVQPLTSSKQYADKADAVTLTCAYTDPASVTATVTWYIDDSSTATTTGVEADGAGKSLMKFASAAVTDNASYKCKVDYGTDYGTKTGTALTQYVRSIETGVTGTQYALIGTAVTHTCTVYGDVLTGNVVWTNTAGALATGATYTQATGTYSTTAYTTVSTLKISAVASADTTTFTCTLTYTQGTTEKTGTIGSEILGKYSTTRDCEL